MYSTEEGAELLGLFDTSMYLGGWDTCLDDTVM